MKEGASSRSNRNDPGILKFAAKWVIAGVIIFGGIAGGVYTGMALTGHEPWQPSQKAMTNQTLLEIGEEFPDYMLTDASDSTQLSISDLCERGPVLLTFVSRTCNACGMINTYWTKKVALGVDPSIQLTWVYNEYEGPPQEEDIQPPPQVRIVTTERSSQLATDGIVATPTLIGLGQDRRILFILYGFDKNVDEKYINENFGL